ncbi:adenosine/AMP deaminase [Colletotrichum karsti]|uniref:adenosine deaminase n=1 Tax=Colletotrichum karsti TaxID=1095194 RepID=A0A9P6IEI4_9PEZI|nr:adenosine/AMP deaminase [Colletotrichum karsti]KAF9881922.1 adenosine/AMP deaminase [Colletotrichum karsti]
MHFSNVLVAFAFTASSVAGPLPESDGGLWKWDSNVPEWDSSLPVKRGGSSITESGEALLKRWEAMAEDNPAVIRHKRLREMLVDSEKLERQDARFRGNLSDTCAEADVIVQNVRQAEFAKFWREGERFPGQMFALARDQIVRTELWKIVQQMPKGALLHAHLSAMLPYGKLLDIVLNTPGMVFKASQSLNTTASRDAATIEFAYSSEAVAEGVSVYSPDYNGQLTPVSAAADGFPAVAENHSNGTWKTVEGREGFKKFVKSKMVITDEEAIHHELGVDQIWQRFQGLFDPAGGLFTYELVVRQFWRELFGDLAADGISWVEIRAGGSADKMAPAEGSTQDRTDPDFWWTVMWEELNDFKNQTAANTTHPFHGARVIWSDYRGRPKDKILQSMQSALLRKQNPVIGELFSGYDLVGQEDISTLESWVPLLYAFQEEAKNKNVTMPFFFHAGETVGDGNTTDSNLFDAIELGTRRIGHGFSLYKHPKLVREVKEKNILVEVCPISNEVLRLATDILHHPLPAMIAHGVPTAISNDDPAMMGQDTAGLSFDFYQVIQGFDNVGLAGLGALAQNSLRWSNFEDQDDVTWHQDVELGQDGTGIKADRIQQWNEQWEQYCGWVKEKAYKNLSPKTRLGVGVAVLAWGGVGLYFSDQAEEKYKPTAEEKAVVDKYVPKVHVVDKS